MTETPPEWTDDELDSVAEALQDASLRLQTTEPDEPQDYLESLRDIFEGATVVGIGEASHGIRDCFRYRHRLLRYLVEELGYRTVGIEVNFSATPDLTEYVTTGEGTAQDALSNDGIHPQWQSEAALYLVEWAHDFNEGRPPDDQIRFYGLDVQSGRPTARALASYLERVDPGFFDEVADELQYLSTEQVDFEAFWTNPEQIDVEQYSETCHHLVPKLEARFEEREEVYVDQSSEHEFDRARRQVDLLDIVGKIVTNRSEGNQDEGIELREGGMAENVSWVLDAESVDQLVVFSHNMHVNRGGWPVTESAEVPSMFDRVTEREDDDTVSVGFSFESAEFRVIDVEDGGWDRMHASDPPRGSIPEVLSRMECDDALVDVQALPEEGAVAEWLVNNPERQFLNSKTQPPEPAHYVETDLQTIFDALLFVREGTAAQGIDE